LPDTSEADLPPGGRGASLATRLAALVGLLLAGCAAATPPPVPSTASGYLAELLAEAEHRDLAGSAGWLALLHYERGRSLRPPRSYIRSKAFFLAARGASDPAAELRATLEALVNGDPARCRYPARFKWLGAELGLARDRLPQVECPKYDRWRADVGPALAASLVFADAFLNNPSSMFGHTLMRFDRVPVSQDADRRDLGAYAVNFAAETGADRGVLYAVRGIVGSYPGYYSLMPYYEKVRQYGDLESRDLWEYPLALTPEQVELLIEHLFELRDVAFPYYYFTQNCSFHLLGLLEVARPDLELLARFRTHTIPSDSLRAVLEEVGLAGTPRYRPSAATRLAHEAHAVPAEDWALAREVARGERKPDDPRLAGLGEERHAAILTLAYDELAYERPSEEHGKVRKRALELLAARSHLAVRGAPGGAPDRPAVRPDEGHRSGLVRTGAGVRDGSPFFELGVRPALHDLLDPLGGYVPNAEITFLDTAIRYYPNEGKVNLHRLTLVEVVSATPRDDVFTPTSWSFSTGLENDLVEDRDRGDLRAAYVYRTRGGPGLTYRLGTIGAVYGFVEATADVSTALAPAYALGPCARVGIELGDGQDRWRGHLHAGVDWYVLGDTRTALSLGLDQRLRLTERLGLELAITGRHDFGQTWLDAGLFLRTYY
jgi:hypothetical protein